MKKSVLVGLSGGVDSSVAAALLKSRGWDVYGAFIKSWFPEGFPCPWRQERRDAIRVAAHLDIPFYTIDATEAYKREVADVFLSEYQRGRIPNPDVLCNREVKFKFLAEYAKQKNISHIATGHYGRLNQEGESVRLYKGVDTEKDQSYFLWAVPQELLDMALFPVGELTKPEVRDIARKENLPTAGKKDSQGVCFLGPIDMRKYLEMELGTRPGTVSDEEGNPIGTHHGAHLYTIGQRHGFTVTTKENRQQPYYVVAKDIEKNTITVSATPGQFGALRVELDDVNWIGQQKEGTYDCLIRYRATPAPCKVEKDDGGWIIVFETRQEIAPGQSIVWYDGEILVGGGIAVDISYS